MATPIITEVTYAELEELITEGLLEPGLQYKITDFATVHWLYDGNYVTEEPPAPGNILIVPDAVGSNPITYYYRVVYIVGEGEARSQFSAEGSYTEGDSTAETLFSCDAIPSWATQVFIIRGTESEVYNESFAFENNNQDIFDRFASAEGIYETALAVSLYPLKIVKTAEPESLIVTAISTNAIAKQVQSVEHPNDIIEYCWSAEYVSYLNIPEFWDASLLELVPGFKGVITRRKDTIHNIDMPFDWRNIWYRTWDITQPAWSDSITYVPTNQSDVIGDFVTHNSIIYWCISECTDIEPGVDEGWETYWKELVGLTDSFFGSYIVTNRQGMYHQAIPFISEEAFYRIPIVDLEEYRDIRAIEGQDVRDIFHGGSQYIPRIIIGEDSELLEFGEAVSDVMIGSSCSVISIGQSSGEIFMESGCGGMTIGSNCEVMTFGSSCGGMTFGLGCGGMTFGSSCGGMTFGLGCSGMTFGSSCEVMTFGLGCSGMTIGSNCEVMTFGSNCGGMTFGSNCGGMTFGSNCGGMTFGSGCGEMTFGSSCVTMTFGSYCGTMTFGSSCGAMTFGSSCYGMTFGLGCGTMTFGSNCGGMTFGSYCGGMTFPDYTAYNDFKDGVGNVDFTSEGVTQHDDGSSITHQLVSVDSSIEVVQSYLEWVTDHYEMCYTTNTIGTYQQPI